MNQDEVDRALLQPGIDGNTGVAMRRIAVLSDAVRELREEVKREHDLYLTAHRDNMKGATLLMEARKDVERLKALYAAEHNARIQWEGPEGHGKRWVDRVELTEQENAALRQQLEALAGALNQLRETQAHYEPLLAEAKANRDKRLYELQEVAYLACLRDALNTQAAAERPPVPLVMYCPAGHSHVDEGEWATRPHKTHQCQEQVDVSDYPGSISERRIEKCGLEWRPADFPTVGVKAERPPAQEKPCGHGDGVDCSAPPNGGGLPCQEKP